MHLSSSVLLFALLASPAAAAPCGGDFAAFVAAMKAEAVAAGQPATTVDAFFAGVRQDGAVLKADRSQSVFRKSFLEFSKSLISKDRMQRGLAKAQEWDAVFQRAETEFGVPRGILLAFWAFETDYGAVQGDFNTRNALVTLAHDCRRPDLFQPQVLAALELFRLGEFSQDTTGAWAGEIGMVQMLPADILERGVDGDGDGLVTLKTSAPDALMSGAKMLSHHGWRAGEPWGVRATIPAGFDRASLAPRLDAPTCARVHARHSQWRTVGEWRALGIQPQAGIADSTMATLFEPDGPDTGAFLLTGNYRVILQYNCSNYYALSVGLLADEIAR